LGQRYPQNRSQKGAATDRVVHVNQLSFIDKLDEPVKVVRLKGAPEPARRIITWYICTYCEGEDFRAEVSCPKGVDDGYFINFYERIFLTEDDDGGGGEIVRRQGGGDDSGGSDFEISVTRKKKK